MSKPALKKTLVINIAVIAAVIAFIIANTSLSGQTDYFSSPNGRTHILVKYDFVSRPTVYKKEGLIFNKKLWSYEGAGFTETVWFEPEWISDTEFIFRYDDKNDEFDEEFLIKVN